MQASLYSFSGVEGSLWQPREGFFAYAYPTYEGTTAKTDLPAAERDHIEGLVTAALRDKTTLVDERRGLREAVITAACPVNLDQGLMAWTLTRIPLGPARGFEHLAVAGALLLAFLVGSGIWVARLGLRWSRAFSGVERALEAADAETNPAMERTGIVELDRVVEAHNRHARRLAEARAEASALTARASQMDRLGALGRMAAGLAHEIRNPVAAMRLKVENALAGPPARQEAALRTILGHVGRIERLVGEMLAFAQPIALRTELVVLVDFVRERVELVHERAEAAGVAVSGVAGPEACAFDPEQMARAVDNLLINALQHTPAGGYVKLGAEVIAGRLRMAVCDSGPGVSPEMATRLFEPFSTSRSEGTGLGLSIAREIAVAHGGSLTLQPSDCGALFVIELPCRPS